MDAERDAPSVKWATITIIAIVIVIVASVVALSLRPDKEVSNFDQCIDAGGSRMESYPEQCLYDGKTYVNESQQVPKYDEGYIGLSESDALSKANDDDVPARVVERDGESLPVTMDLVFGRHNFYVRDGEVYKVEIEGSETIE